MAKAFIETILSQMTLEEKLGQMTQLAPEFLGMTKEMPLTGPMNTMNFRQKWQKDIGSTLNYFGARQIKKAQKKNMEESRLKIPMLFAADVIHGYKTVFPIPLAIGCSFNPDNYKRASSIAAAESAASGIHLTFAPMTDLVRDPRWGRVMESTGEDAYLNSVMAKAAVEGFQGDSCKSRGHIAACVKHFAGYGAPWGGRDYNTVDLSEGMLREYYLPAYKAAVEAGAAMVMTSFNTINRIPASANQWLLRDILRKEWGFNKAVISDYAAVDETIEHGVSKDGSEAAEKCIKAGVDIEMMSLHYLTYVKKLIDDKALDEKLIDEAVRRILELKDALGLFENPYKDASEEDEERLHLCEAHRKAAYEIALECAVLLKNNGILPLNGRKKIGIVGPFADTGSVLGGWTAGEQRKGGSLYESLKELMPGAQFVLAMTGELGALQDSITDVDDRICEIREKLSECDVVIAAVGENSSDTGEAASKTNLRLSRNQERMMFALKELKCPVIMVVFSGRPLEIYPVLDCADAVLQAWFLGCESGRALAALITGKENPSGRLAMSFPYTVGQIPVHYNRFNTGRPAEMKTGRYLSKYLDCPNEPLYPFGFGLSYSEFCYSGFEVRIVQKGLNTQGRVAEASVWVENTSKRRGKETVQLYIRDITAQTVRPVMELKGFKQLVLEAGEKRRVTFELTKEMLSYWNSDGRFIFEPGLFDIMVGHSSSEVEKIQVYIGE